MPRGRQPGADSHPAPRPDATPALLIAREPVPQAARRVGTGTDPAWRAVSATGDAEYGAPVAERATADRAFATSADTPLESDVNQQIPPLTPGADAQPEEESGVPDADPDEDLAAGPPDGR